MWVCLYSTFLWQVKHESSRILKEQVLYPHILIYKNALLFCISIWHYVLKEYLILCSNFYFVHNSNLLFKEGLNIFLLDLRSKYVLCLLFLKENSRFPNYLCVEYLWPHFIILFELADLHKSKNGSINHFNWWVFPV